MTSATGVWLGDEVMFDVLLWFYVRCFIFSHLQTLGRDNDAHTALRPPEGCERP